ncbi:hypothetical protein PIIN_03090 [Serendipita indica DSM 11827]|uniref:PNPLA domain-containing protein n=1 Tax=Serendipita indica (strain DSM 11827) TaxID=1109443 RepID=G4TD11_SERID|nr:hypothetical protein PIIN_03090 [Serendipita indica DSM 11827]
MNGPISTGPGLRLLVLDGGDTRSISQLVILDQIMKRVSWKDDPQHEECIKPCEFFDLVMGVGTGAVIAMLLVVCRATIPEAKRLFFEFCKDVFQDGQMSATERTKRLESALENILSQKGLSPDTMLLEQSRDKDRSLLVIGATSAANLQLCRHFRTYRSCDAQDDVSILDAIHASCAHANFINSAFVGKSTFSEEYTGTKFFFNNPAREAIQEARSHFGPMAQVACVLSLGYTGYETWSASTSGSRTALLDVDQTVARETERIATELERQLGTRNVFFRFAVEKGLESPIVEVSPMSIGAIKSTTESYLGQPRVSSLIDQYVATSSHPGVLTISAMCALQSKPLTVIQGLPPLSKFHVVRQRQLALIAESLFSEEDGQAMVAVTGAGGTGKTQLVARFVRDYRHKFPNVLFLDASSTQTIRSSLIARARDLGHFCKSVEEVLDTLTRWDDASNGPWLMVFDKLDDKDIVIRNFIPSCEHGSIIITSRLNDMGQLSHHHVKLDTMDPNEAASTLLKAALGPSTVPTPAEFDLGLEIAEQLGYLPVVLVQAGCYIHSTRRLHQFLDMLQMSRHKVLTQSIKARDAYEHNVYAMIDVTLDSLSKRAQNFYYLLSFAHHRDLPRPLIKLAAQYHFLLESLTLLERRPDFSETTELLYDTLSPSREWQDHEFDDLVVELQRASLMTVEECNGVVTLNCNSLLLACSQERLSQSEKLMYARAMSRIIASGTTTAGVALHEYLVPHIRALKGYWNQLEVNDRAGFADHLAWPGIADECVQIWESIRDEVEAASGPTSEALMVVLRRLSNAYVLQGDNKRHEHTEESIRRLQSVLEERTISTHEPDPLTPVSANDHMSDAPTGMAVALSSLESQVQYFKIQGSWKEVIRVGRQILNIRDGYFNSDRHATLRTLRLLAVAHEKLNHYADAKALWTRILESQGDSIPKEEHSTTLQHLISCCEILKSYTDLEAALEELIDLQLGDESTSREAIEETTLRLRMTYEKTQRHFKIDHLLKRILDTNRERQCPQDVICADIDRLATYYGDYGESSKEEEYLNLLIQEQKALYGVRHVSTVRTMRRLLSLLVHLGREEEAAQLRKLIESITLSQNALDRTEHLKRGIEDNIYGSHIPEALAGLTALLISTEPAGSEHIDVLEWAANTYETIGYHRNAETLWRDVLQVLRRDSIANEPSIRVILNRIAHACEMQAKYTESIVELLQLLDMEPVDDYEGRVSIMERIATDYESCSDWTSAEQMRENIVDVTRKKVGITHDNYWSTLCKLLTLRLSQGKPKEAWNPLVTYLSRLLLRDIHNREAYLLLVDICRGLGEEETTTMWAKSIQKEYSYLQVSLVTGICSHVQRLGSSAVKPVVVPLIMGYCGLLEESITTVVSPKIDDSAVRALVLGVEVLDRAYEAYGQDAPIVRVWRLILAAKSAKQKLEIATSCDVASRYASTEIVLQNLIDHTPEADTVIAPRDLLSRLSSIQSRRSLRDDDVRAWSSFEKASDEGDVEAQRTYLRDPVFKSRVERLIKSHQSHNNTDAALQKLHTLSSVQRSVLGIASAETLFTIDQTLQICKEERRFQEAEQLLRQCKEVATREDGGAFFAIAVREAKVRQWAAEAS